MQMSRSNGLVALVVSSFFNINCAAVQHAVRESIAYQTNLQVLYTEKTANGEYDVFVDSTRKCRVDFTSYVIFSNAPLDSSIEDSRLMKELLVEYCPE